MDLSEPQAPAAGMRRIITVDALAPGDFNIYPLDGNVFITGENAAGKSTLLNMLALQAGGRIIDLTTTEATLNHYFRNATSYVVLEYLHRDGKPRCVIIWRSETGAGGGAYRYRFVRGEVVREMFLDAEGNFITPAALGAHLRRLGYDCTSQIDTTVAFRAVLQGDDRSADRATRKEMRNWIAHYSLAVPGSRLTDLEKLISAMITRKTPYETFISVLADKIGEEVKLSAVGGEDEFRAWLKNYRAVRDVAALSGRVDEVVRLDVARRAGLERLGLLRAEAEASGEQMSTRQTDLERRQQENKHALAAANEAHDVRISALRERRSDHEMEKVTAGKQVTIILADQEKWEASGIVARKARLDTLPDIRAKRAETHALHDRLTGDSTHIETEYQRLILEATELGHIRLEEARREADEQNSALREREQKIGDDAERDRAAEDLRWSGEREELSLRGTEKEATLVLARERLAHAAANPDLVAALDEAREAEREAALALHQRNTELTAAERRHEDARRDIEASERDISKRRDDLAGLRSRLSDLELRIAPPAGSVLALLRDSGRDWTPTIGKALAPELLVHPGLSPSLEAGDNSIFGLSLDLSDIPDRIGQEIEELEASREALIGNIRAADAALLEAEQLLKRRAAHRTETQRYLSEQSHHVEMATGERVKMEKRVAAARAAVEQSLNAERQSRSEAVQTAMEGHKVHLQGFKEAEGHHMSHIRAIQDRRTSGIRDVRAQQIAVDAGMKRRQAELQAEIQTSKTALEAEKAERLAGQGIDPARLGELAAAIRRFDEEIHDIESERALVDRWLSWTRTALAGLPELEAKRDAAAVALEQIIGEISHLERDHAAAAAAMRADLAAMGKEISDLREMKAALALVIEDLADYRPGQISGLTRPAAEIHAEAKGLLATQRTQNRGCEKLIEELRRAFTRDSGTPPDDFIQSRMNTGDEGRSIYGWIPHFRDWFERDGKETERVLRMTLESTGGKLNDFHEALRRIQRVITSWNRRLQSGFNSTMQFATVSELEISITSQVHEFEAWGLIRRFSEHFGAWLAAGKPETLEDVFLEVMREMSESKVLQRGIQVDIASLIGIAGRVVENGKEKTFRRASDFTGISSNGVTNMLMTYLLIAFANVIRDNSRVRLAFPFDEIGAISELNIRHLVKTLNANDIHVISATTGGKEAVADLFDYRLRFDQGGVVQATRESIRVPLRILATREEAEDLRAEAAGGPATSSEVAADPDPMDVALEDVSNANNEDEEGEPA